MGAAARKCIDMLAKYISEHPETIAEDEGR
jgi:hypothetical protein